MKIGQKLIGSFAIVAIIGAVIGGVGWYGIGVLDESMDDIASVRLPSVDIMLTMDAKMGDIATAQMELINPNASIEDAKILYADIDNVFGEIEVLQNDFKQYISDDADAKNYNNVLAAFNDFKSANDEFVTSSKEMDRTGIRNPTQVKLDITNIEASHRDWMFQLSESVVEGLAFKGQLDPTKCALGTWMEEYDLENQIIKNSFADVKISHDKLHHSGRKIKEILAKGNTQANRNLAMKHFDDVSIPSMDEIIDQLKNTMNPEADKSYAIQDRLNEIDDKLIEPSFDVLMDNLGVLVADIKADAKASQKAGDEAVQSSHSLLILSTIFGFLISLGFGFFIARSISKPVQARRA